MIDFWPIWLLPIGFAAGLVIARKMSWQVFSVAVILGVLAASAMMAMIVLSADTNSTAGVAVMIVGVLTGLGALPGAAIGKYLRHR